MKSWIIFAPLLLIIFSCSQPPTQQAAAPKKTLNVDSLKTVLINTDAAFSDLSSQKGVHEAFMAYVADKGTILRPYHMPIGGKDSVRAYLYARPDSAFTLTWKPIFADVASSGDLGYTYGTYKLSVKHSKESEEGTYCSIWKQDAAGNWKFVLDTGNPGLNPAKQLTN